MTLQDNRLSNRRSVHRVAFLAAAVLLATSAIIVLGVQTAGAHGNPEVSMDPNPAPSGGEVTIEGEGFEEDSEVGLALEGALGEISLGTATTDSEGVFSLTVMLPATAAPGSYRIRAVGPEDVAVADVRILEGEGGAALAGGHEAEVGFHGVGPAAEVVGFAGLAAVLALAGVALLWLPRGERHV